MKRWYKSKTLWLNAILAGLTAVEASLGLLREALGPQSYLGVIGLVAAANAALRIVTRGPIK